MGLYFFLQAEGGIRDYKVTGVQTCALPILAVGSSTRRIGQFPARALAIATRCFCPPDKSRGKLIALSASPVSQRDRKSTRLNSSHLVISYAVFCLKKKKT